MTITLRQYSRERLVTLSDTTSEFHGTSSYKLEVKSIIDYYDKSISRPISSSEVFYDMSFDLIKLSAFYEPEENREFIANEADYEFSKYLFSLIDKRDFDIKQQKTIVRESQEFLRNNLVYHIGWSPLKTGRQARYFEKIQTWFDNQDTVCNPFETMSPEYVLTLYTTCVKLQEYVHSEEFLNILNRRLIEFNNQEFVESMQGGSNNRRRITAVNALFEIIGAEPSEEFKALFESDEEPIQGVDDYHDN